MHQDTEVIRYKLGRRPVNDVSLCPHDTVIRLGENRKLSKLQFLRISYPNAEFVKMKKKHEWWAKSII